MPENKPSPIECENALVTRIACDVTEIKHALIGTKYSRGIKHQVEDQEKRVRRLERVYFIGLGLVIIGSFIIQYVWR